MLLVRIILSHIVSSNFKFQQFALKIKNYMQILIFGNEIVRQRVDLVIHLRVRIYF